MSALIPLTGRRGVIRGYAIVDEEDYDALAGQRWHISGGYAVRIPRIYGVRVHIAMHRVVCCLTPDDKREIDHINQDKLDNRRSNLRIVTHAQNAQNVRSHLGSTSLFRGVSWDAASGKWRAVGYLDRRIHHLGRFEDEQEAARVVAAWRAEHMPYSAEAAA